MFTHLHFMYSAWGECRSRRFSSWPQCRAHWIHNVTSLEDFAEALRVRWAQVTNRTRNGGFHRHMEVMRPQRFYVGDRTRVLCTRDLDAELPVRNYSRTSKDLMAAHDRLCTPLSLHVLLPAQALAADICPNGVRAHADATVPRKTHGIHRRPRREPTPLARNGSRPSAPTAGLRMTETGCAAIRRVYAADVPLYERFCAAQSGSPPEQPEEGRSRSLGT
jgi:hypothetical protein